MNNDKIYSFVRDLVSLKKAGVDVNMVAVSLRFYTKFEKRKNGRSFNVWQLTCRKSTVPSARLALAFHIRFLLSIATRYGSDCPGFDSRVRGGAVG